MGVLRELFSPTPPEFTSGRTVGRRLGSGVQEIVYESGNEKVIKLLREHFRRGYFGDYQGPLEERLTIQKQYLSPYLPQSAVEQDTLVSGEQVKILDQERLDLTEMRPLKELKPEVLAHPIVHTQLDDFTGRCLQMIDETGLVPDLSGNNYSIKEHFNLRKSENIWVHKERGLILLDVVNAGFLFTAENPVGSLYVNRMRSAVVNFRKDLGFDISPIVAG